MMARALAISGFAALGLSGCTQAPQTPGFRVADLLRIDDTLINILVETTGPDAQAMAPRYVECVAAQYALDHGYGFARHIRTNRSKTGGAWQADAVYSITPALPQGSRTLDVEVIVQTCAELGIPTG